MISYHIYESNVFDLHNTYEHISEKRLRALDVHRRRHLHHADGAERAHVGNGGGVGAWRELGAQLLGDGGDTPIV